MEGSISFNYISTGNSPASSSDSFPWYRSIQYSSLGYTSTSISGAIGVYFDKSKNANVNAPTKYTITGTGFIPVIVGFTSNLKGSGIINMELIGGHYTSSDGTNIWSKSEHAIITFTVSEGIVTDISYNFRLSTGRYAYYPYMLNISVL